MCQTLFSIFCSPQLYYFALAYFHPNARTTKPQEVSDELVHFFLYERRLTCVHYACVKDDDIRTENINTQCICDKIKIELDPCRS